jgi:N-acyl-D-amino-acid deacylase
MGVTTLVTGNCGGSVLDVGAYFRRLDATNVSINVATLIGHGTVRSKAMRGSFNRPPTDKELATMKSLVEQAMRDGAVGLSTGLIYLPGLFAKTDEIIELAKVASAHGGIHATHMRNDPANVQTEATYKDPHHCATGFAWVFVNGVAVVKNDIHTGARPGRPLRHRATGN